MTNTLKSKITFSNGGTDQSNFFDYPLLSHRRDARDRRAIIMPSDRPPQGVGEVVLAPVAPAIAQALLHATGRTLDVMPFPDARVQGRGLSAARNERQAAMPVKFHVNGKPAEFDGPDDVPLLWVVREHLRADRQQIRLRRRRVRRLHHAHRRRADPHLRACPSRRRKTGRSRPSRASSPNTEPSGPEGLDRARRSAMRLLPVRDDHGGGVAARSSTRIRPTATSTRR